MTKNRRVSNVSRGYSMKHSQALKAVENCACAWIEFGVSVRDLTLAESIKARNEQSAARDPLPGFEIPGLIFRPALGQEASHRNGRELSIEANQWAALQTA